MQHTSETFSPVQQVVFQGVATLANVGQEMEQRTIAFHENNGQKNMATQDS